MTAVLYYSRNPNPRLALAVARHLAVEARFEWAAPLHPDQIERFRVLNPALRVPIWVEPGRAPLWEADAIACRLSQIAGSEFWRMGAMMPDMIRWISWGKENFVRACDMVHFERGTKPRYGLGPLDQAALDEGLARFREAADLLDAHLQRRDYLLDDGPSYADFRMACFLPFNDVAGLPLVDHPHLSAWYDRVAALPGWAAPFDGLDAPALPPVPPQA